MGEIERLQAELAKAHAEIDRLKQFEPRLISLEHGEIKVRVAREVMQNMVEAFAELNGDSNYTRTVATIEPSIESGDTRRFEVIVQSANKPTPHDKRVEAESRLTAALDVLRAVEWRTRLKASGKVVEWCIICGAERPHGSTGGKHAPDCALNAALRDRTPDPTAMRSELINLVREAQDLLRTGCLVPANASGEKWASKLRGVDI